MQKIISVFSHPMIKKLDSELEKVFDNAPHLPKKVLDVLVKIIPYLILISGVFLITGGLQSIFGTKSFHNVFYFWRNVSPVYFYVVGSLQVLAGIISVTIYQPLKDKKIDAWFALLGLIILELLMNIISVIFLNGGIFGLLFGLLISLYFLYEIKNNYSMNIIKKTKSTKKSSKK